MSQKSRINKYIALCGVCSRRAAEKLISDGKVSVNDVTLTADDLSTSIQHDVDIVKVNGKRIKPDEVKRYILLNKPKLCVSTVTDPQKRTTVIDILHRKGKGAKPFNARVYPIGRLDFDTQGALLLTNDGELAHRLAHPRYQVEKVYHALINGVFTDAASVRIDKGVKLEDGHLGRAKTKALTNEPGGSTVELILKEGHKHEVKQLLAGCGYQTLALTRVNFAGIVCDGLKPGEWRDLTESEVKTLRKLVL